MSTLVRDKARQQQRNNMQLTVVTKLELANKNVWWRDLLGLGLGLGPGIGLDFITSHIALHLYNSDTRADTCVQTIHQQSVIEDGEYGLNSATLIARQGGGRYAAWISSVTSILTLISVTHKWITSPQPLIWRNQAISQKNKYQYPYPYHHHYHRQSRSEVERPWGSFKEIVWCGRVSNKMQFLV